MFKTTRFEFSFLLSNFQSVSLFFFLRFLMVFDNFCPFNLFVKQQSLTLQLAIKILPPKLFMFYHSVNWFRDLMTKFLTSKIICASGRENLYSQLWNLRVKLSTQYSGYVTQRYQGWTSNENNMDHREHIKDPELLAWRLLCNLLT